MMSNEKPLVSVIMPVYNTEKYVSQAIQSVLDQTYRSLELILIDDGSTDGSGEICDAYARKEARVQVLHTANCGLSHARNRGMDVAHGEWLTFVDSDDLLTPQAVETLVRESGQADVVFCTMEWFPVAFDYPEVSWKEKTYSSFRLALEDYLCHAHFLCFFSACAKLYRRRPDSKMCFDENVRWAEDLLFNLEYLPTCRNIHMIAQPLYRYRREEETSLSHRFYFDEPRLRLRGYEDCRIVLGENNPAMERVAAIYVHHICRYFTLLCQLTSKAKVEKRTIMEYWLAFGIANGIDAKELRVTPKERKLWQFICKGDAKRLYQEILR